VGDPEGAKGLFARGGRLAILLGAYDVAADLLEAAAFKLPAARDDALLLRSARCRLASGDIDKAVDRAEIVLHSAAAPDLLLQARLVEAWAALLGGDMKKAGDTASDIVGKAPVKSDSRREARFIAWMAASGTAKGGAAAALIAEYPSSPEAAIASKAAVGGGKASANGADASAWAELLPATHWYLSGLVSTNPSPASPVPVSAPSVPATPVTPLPAASSPATPTPASPADSQAATTRRFQVGIFADAQNAADLISELAKKGFAARSEKRKVGTRDLIAVIVEGDPSTTSLKLKDSGYESYPLF
jgi:cell division septation protein DedD